MAVVGAVVVAVADRLAEGYCLRALLRLPEIRQVLLAGGDGGWALRRYPDVREFDPALIDVGEGECWLVLRGDVIVSESVRGGADRLAAIPGAATADTPAPPSGISLDMLPDRQPLRESDSAVAWFCASREDIDEAMGRLQDSSDETADRAEGAGWALRIGEGTRWPPRAFVSPWATAAPAAWQPRPALWESGRAVRRAWRRRHPGEMLQALVGLPGNVLRSRSDIVPDPLNADDRLSVTYVLESMVIAGGVLSVIQLVNELTLLGIDARIATRFVDPLVYRWTPLLSRPMVFSSYSQLKRRLPPTDLAVATLWSTAEVVRDVVSDGRAGAGVYFLQDYEPWFFPEADTAARRKVAETYAMLPHRIVKSDWLADKLADDGHDTHKILLGMNVDVFSPSQGDRSGVLAMVRPGTAYRGGARLLRVLREVRNRMPDTPITVFGDATIEASALPEGAANAGVIHERGHLADLYGRSAVFVDLSDHQAFGRCGLEAMACGTATVLSGQGGVNEYADDGRNCILVDAQDEQSAVSAIVALLEDTKRQAALGDAGVRTAQAFDVTREARDTLAYFRTLVDG